MIALRVLALAVGVALAGSAALRLVRCAPRSALERLGLSIAAGSTLAALCLYVPLAAGGRVSFAPVLAVLGVAAAFELRPLVRWARRAPRPRPAAVAVAALFAALVLAADSIAYRGYDGKAIFGLKGKALLYERDVDGDVFQDVDVVHYHPDYPLGVPLLAALAGYAAEGEPVDAAGARPAASAEEWRARHDATDAYLALALLGVLGIVALVLAEVERGARSVLGRALALGVALPAVVVVPSLPNLTQIETWRTLLGGDRPLALALGATALAAARWVDRRERGALALAALCACGAILVKKEATLAVGILVGVLALTRARRGALALAAAGLLGVLVVGLVQARQPGALYDEDFAGMLRTTAPSTFVERVPQVLVATWESLGRQGTRPFWLLFALVAAPLAWRAGGGRRVLAAWVGCWLVAVLAVLVVTPNHVVWHVDTAADRLFYQTCVVSGVLLARGLAELFASPPEVEPCPSSP